MGGILYTIVMLAIVLGVLVFVHELGHYLTAKMFGVWVHRFAVGMGPPIKRLSFHSGETEWAIAWLPLGGYVKMATAEEDPSSSVLEGGEENAVVPPDRMFEAKPVWQRIVIILAGVTLNMVFAWVVFVGLAVKNGRQYDPTTEVGRVDVATLPSQADGLAGLPEGSRIVAMNGEPVSNWDDITSAITTGSGDTITFGFADRPTVKVPLHSDQLVERVALASSLQPLHPPVVAQLVQGSPADKAGIEPGDSMVSIDGKSIGSWTEAVALIEAAPGVATDIVVIREGQPYSFTVTPDSGLKVPGDSSSGIVGRIGVYQKVPIVSEQLSLGGAVSAGSEATWVAAGTIFRTLRGLLTGMVSTKELGGPILIGQMAAQSARAGLDYFLGFMALISVNLAIVNLLPIPVLDGGAFLLLIVEGIIRRPIPNRIREPIQLIGVGLVLMLVVLVFWNDIARILAG